MERLRVSFYIEISMIGPRSGLLHRPRAIIQWIKGIGFEVLDAESRKRGRDMNQNLTISREAIADFCRRNHIRKLALFGSALREDFRPDSDVDILVEFEPEARVGLIRLAGMELELGELLGRKADLRTPQDLSRYFRDEVLRQAEMLYESSACATG
jgi:predicted nucleotidyltransferase